MLTYCFFKKFGAPGKIRTLDPQIRSLVLYPAELPVLKSSGETPHPKAVYLTAKAALCKLSVESVRA